MGGKAKIEKTYLNEKLNSGFGPNARVKEMRTKSWTN